jgi:hypothetical protein
VITEFEFDLHQVGTAALLVDLFYAPQDAPGPLRRWRDLITDAPPQATLTAWVGTASEPPFLPPGLWNRPLTSLGYVWVGDPDQGRELLPTLRNGMPPARPASGAPPARPPCPAGRSEGPPRPRQPLPPQPQHPTTTVRGQAGPKAW